MERDVKRQNFGSREERNPEWNMAKNVSTRSSSFCAVASSSNDSESVSTSPILDTAKIRRKGKLWATRRAVSDSAFSPDLARLTKGQEIQPTCSSTEETKKLDHLSLHRELKQCNRCDSLLDADYRCKNCSPEKSTNRRDDCSDKNLADRLRDLKRHKKPTARISDLKDAQITDEEFVQSARMLDKACNLTPPKKLPQSPKNRLGLVPFIELECFRLSQIEEQKNSPNLPVSHLSLDEDKEEDGDMFADKESPDSPDNLDEFTPWKYKSTENLPSSFHGFSFQEYKNSREIAEKGSQVPELKEIDEVFFSGFSSADIEESESRLQNWETKSSEIKGPNLTDSREDKKEFLSSFKSKNTQFSAYERKESTPEIENEFSNYKLKRKRDPEFFSKIEERCKKKIATNIENNEFSGDCEKREESREIITKVEVESSKNDSKTDFLNSRSKPGFSTAAGRPIALSETAIAKAKLLLSQEIESIDDELLHDFELDNVEDLRRKSGILNAGGFPIFAAKANEGKVVGKDEAKAEEKTEGKFEGKVVGKVVGKAEAKIEGKAEVKTEAKVEGKVEVKAKAKSEVRLEIESIEDELFAELDTEMDSGNKSGLPKVEEKNDKQKDKKLDTAKVSRISCGFSTAAGSPIRVSKKALEKAETLLSKEVESIGNELFAELDTAMDSGNKSGLSKVEEKNENQKDQKLDTAKVSRISCGFSTAAGSPIRVSKKALEKAEAHLAKEIKITEDETFDNLENVIDSGIKPELPKAEDRSLEEKERKLLDPKLDIVTDSPSSSGFSTAAGRPIRASKTALQKAQALLSNENENFENALFHKLNNVTDSEKQSPAQKPISLSKPTSTEIPKSSKEKPTKSLENEVKINFGFATASGRELKVSEKSWSKYKAAFDSIDVSSVSDLPKTETQDTKIISPSAKPKTMISGFSTASGRSINITTEAISAAEAQLSSDLDNIESLEFDDFVEESDVSKKRKLEEIDEDTPLRRDASLKRKRGRYVNDLQARKLFIEDSSKEDHAEIPKKTPEKNLISEEVDAMVAALLEDEERSNEGKTWQINAVPSGGSISPELGCEIGNRSRADFSTRNSFGILNRDELEKVNADRGDGCSGSSRAASSGLGAGNYGNNHRAASAEKKEEIQHESIPDDLTFNSQFSQDIQRSPVIDKFIADAMKIIEGRLAVALKQDEAIRGKRRTKIEHCDGFLHRLRNVNKEKRTSWNELADGIPPSAREMDGDSSGKDIVSVTADSAINYSFRCADFYGEMDVRRNIEGIKVGDEAFLVLDEKNCAGPREFERAFLASPGVDPNLVPTGWVRNHYRWIVWKLASMDRVKFGHKCLPRMLTPDRVMSELKYRYDREIYRTEWPPLRRILERGEDASVRLVLCVSSIIEVNDVNAPVKGAHTPSLMGSTMYKMKVTDGWYSISTSIDAAMMNFIKSGKVREGTKLMIFGAKAMNLDQGCSVLEIPEAVTLRIYSNSTRRAKWNTKLDFYRINRGPMPFSLKSVKPNGGAICKLVVAVSRVYPILYREKLPDGQFVFRNARCDEEAARAHEARYQAKMEEIYANAWSEFQIGSMNRKGIGTTKNCGFTQEEAAACGRNMEEELRERISSKMSECLPTPRDVTPVMKIRIAEDDTYALVTVWSTERDTTELFVEGSSIAIYNAFASGLRSSELQITAGRSTFVKREISRRISYPERIYTPLSDVTEFGFNPIYGEFDTIGIVSSIGPAPHGMKNFETVNLACPKPGDSDASDFLSVLFWQGIGAHGYAKILTVGSLVACSNLEWRRNTSRSLPTAYCTERSVFSKNPRQNHLVQAFEILRSEIKEPQIYAATCATVIEEEIAKKSALRTPGSSGTPYRPATSNNRTPGWSPRDLAIDATCTTPKIDSRKISTRKRLERLEAYGEPPKLPSIVINNSSRKVSSAFRSPVLIPVTKS